jgi:Conjugative transposon protein TcpC
MSAAASERAVEGWQSVRRVRHAAAAPRLLACGVLAIFFLLGVRAAFFGERTKPPPVVAEPQADAPSRAFALQFARAYLTYDVSHPGRRAEALAPYLGGGGLAAGAGFSASHSSQRVKWVELASDQPALAGGRLLTVAAALSTQTLPLYLAISVAHRDGGGVELLGYPSIVGAPLIDRPELPAREAVTAPPLLEVTERVMRNYLSGAAEDLRADLLPSAEITLPTLRLRLSEVQSVQWLGEPGSAAVIATVVATGPRGETYTLSYELGITNRDRPYVTYVEVIPSDR